ncbi:MAG TPA: PAS domain-containing protein [Steroidobacteraceae bacterium]|nr:PAS domain-containing protein [Steroidobacteraceae bacterium]
MSLSAAEGEQVGSMASRSQVSIGPRFADRPAWLRYGTAALLVMGIAAIRAALAPILGAQAPLLPFVISVLMSVWLGGRGPGILASLLAPLVATVWFAEWPNGGNAMQWSAHVLLFLATALLVCHIMSELQRMHGAQMQALSSAREASRRSRESGARLSLMANALPLLVSYVEQNERFRFANATLREWLDCDPADPPLHLREVLGETLYAESVPQVQAVLRGKVVRFDARIRHHKLGVRLCEVTYVPEQGADGLVRGFYVLAQDVTERRKAEETLRARERLLKLIYDNASDGLCLIGIELPVQFRFLSVNPSFLRTSGYTCEQVQGRLLEEVIPTNSQALVREKFQEALDTRQPVVYREVADLPAGRRFAEVTVAPIGQPKGPIAHLLVAHRDVTAREQAEQQLCEANRRKDEFLAMLAHELRNPLAPIRNVAHILANEALDAAAVRRSSELLQRQAIQLTRLVDDLLDVARITRGAVELKKETLALERVLGLALESVQPLLDIKQQTVSLTRSLEPVFVDADPVRLCQIFVNLLNNAAKYSPERTQIRFVVECVQEDVFVSVLDEGMGIDPQMLPNIFDLFLQGDRTLDRSEGGLGIGLTIVKHLVEMHGGWVEARSAGLGSGSEFRVQLPRTRPPQGSVRIDPEDAGRPHRARRILVVEDNHDSAESLALLLRMAGQEVVVVHDGPAALSALESFVADFILLDIGLPGMDGYLVAQSIRTRFPDRATLLYAMTGYGRPEDRAQAIAAGFDDHLTKPVDPERLLAMTAGDRAGASAIGRLH